MTHDDLEDMQRDCKRLQTQPGGLEILAQLHDCTEQDAAELLGIPCRKGKKKDGRTGNTRRRYSKSLKRMVIKDVLEGGMTRREAAERYGLPIQTVQGWAYHAKSLRKEGDR